MRTNLAVTHEGATVREASLTPKAALRRAVMSCLLWEDTFYESGIEIGERIRQLVPQVPAQDVAALAIEARNQGNLRHVPLLLLRELARHPHRRDVSLSGFVPQVVKRADEMGELLALYGRIDGKPPIAAGIKRGLAKVILSFDEYQLAKYDRKKDAVRLRDVIRLVHPKPKDPEQSALLKRVIDGTLATPDTWETNLSSGGDKKETFERLIREKKLGYMALLRNLRNMIYAGCDMALVKEALLDRKGASRVLPFRFVSAIKAAPSLASTLDRAMLAAIEGAPRLPGATAVLVDTSGSMLTPISARSALASVEAAAALACLINGDVRAFSFATDVVEVPFFRGLAGFQQFRLGQVGHGTMMGNAVEFVNRKGKFDRIIIVSDMQSADVPPAPHGRGYMINVRPYCNAVGYGDGWTNIDGFSEQTLRYIAEIEKGG